MSNKTKFEIEGLPKDPFDRSYAIQISQLQTLLRLNDSLEELNERLEQVSGVLGQASGQSSSAVQDTTIPITYIKTTAYNEHWFTSFSYGINTQTTKDIFQDLKFKKQPESLIFSPTTTAQIEFDGNDVTATTPSVIANSYSSWPLHITFIHVLGAVAGTLNVFGFWS